MNTLLCITLAFFAFALADWQTCTAGSDTGCESEETCCSCHNPRNPSQTISVCLEPEHCPDTADGLCDTDRQRESTEEEDNDHDREEDVCGCSVEDGGFNFLRCAVPYHHGTDDYDDWDEHGDEINGEDDSSDDSSPEVDSKKRQLDETGDGLGDFSVKRQVSEDDVTDEFEDGEGDDDFDELDNEEKGRRCGCIQRFTQCGDDCQLSSAQRDTILSTVCSGLPASFSGCAICTNHYHDDGEDGLLSSEDITAFIVTFEHAIEDYITAQVPNIDSFDLVYAPASATEPETVTVSVTVTAGQTFVETDVLNPLRRLFDVDANTFQLNLIGAKKRAGTTYGYLAINDQSSASSLAIGLFAICIAFLALF